MFSPKHSETYISRMQVELPSFNASGLRICFFLSKFLGAQSPFHVTIRFPKVQRKIPIVAHFFLSLTDAPVLHITKHNYFCSLFQKSQGNQQLHRFVSSDLNQLKHIVQFSLYRCMHYGYFMPTAICHKMTYRVE